MAGAGPDLAPPPGFETYAGDTQDLDPAEIAEFEKFMGIKLDSGNALPSSIVPVERKAEPRDQGGAACAGGHQKRAGLDENSAVVEVWDGQGGAKQSDVVKADVSFNDLALPKLLLDGVHQMGYVKPSKIQAAALPRILWRDGQRGQNMIGQAQNGSGKTAAFALALLSAIDVSRLQPQALVLSPTRELAKQNETVIQQLGQCMEVKTFLVCPQEHLPRGSPCHVLVGTPGKTWDLSKKRVLDTSSVSVLVLDEADVMLDPSQSMGEQITQIRKFLPAELQVLFFSATYPDDVRRFAEHIVGTTACNIKVSKTDLTVATIAQMYVRCKTEDEKMARLNDLYAAMNVSQSIVFVNARHKAFHLAKRMKDLGHSVSLICGTQKEGEERMDPAQRDQVMHEFRHGITKVLIATDVLSRGIDVPQVTLVVNYELPANYGDKKDYMETYLHRVGRTGRFGAKGIAVNLIADWELPKIQEICDYFGAQIPEMETDFEALEARLRELR